MQRVGTTIGVLLGAVACGGTAPGSSGIGLDQGTGGDGNGGASTGGSGGGGWGDGGATAACVTTDDHATLDLTLPYVPDGGAWRSRDDEVTGRITSVSTDQFELDSCPPAAACFAAMTSVITIKAAGLDLHMALLEGAFAHVRYVRSCPFNCTDSIVVESVAAWSGVTNPHPSITGLYVAAADSQVSPLGAPYTVTREHLSCSDPWSGQPNCGGGTQGAYRLIFSDGLAEPVGVDMGQVSQLPFRGSQLVVRNLRSYETGYCDDPGQFAHWAVEPLPTL